MANGPTGSVRNKKRRAGAEDVEIGRKIRALRLQRGLSQSGLADAIGLTFQQVQKYEKGTNRVSAGRLHRIAELLNIPVMFFYRGMGPRTKKKNAGSAGLALIQSKGAIRLLRSYADISSRTARYALVVLAESLSSRERASGSLPINAQRESSTLRRNSTRGEPR